MTIAETRSKRGDASDGTGAGTTLGARLSRVDGIAKVRGAATYALEHRPANLAHAAEVIGFRGANVLSMPVESAEGIRFGDRVSALGKAPQIEVGPALIGRVLNALGQPIDGQHAPVGERAPVERVRPR